MTIKQLKMISFLGLQLSFLSLYSSQAWSVFTFFRPAHVQTIFDKKGKVNPEVFKSLECDTQALGKASILLRTRTHQNLLLLSLLKIQ